MFIREGMLKKVCRKSVKPRYFFLFTDALIYGRSMPVSTGLTQRYILHSILDLSHLRMEDVPGTVTCMLVYMLIEIEVPNSFEIATPMKSFIVVCSSQKEKIDWML